MTRWAVAIFDSARSFHAVYLCDNELLAKKYVINTMNHYKSTEYLCDDEIEYKIDGYTNGILQLRILEPNGEVTSICAMPIGEKYLEQKQIITCYKSYEWPRLFEIESEEERERNVRLIWLRHIAEERRNNVKLDKENTIYLLDDEYVESNELYISICFTNGDQVYGAIVDMKPLENRKWYDCTEDV